MSALERELEVRFPVSGLVCSLFTWKRLPVLKLVFNLLIESEYVGMFGSKCSTVFTVTLAVEQA